MELGLWLRRQQPHWIASVAHVALAWQGVVSSSAALVNRGLNVAREGLEPSTFALLARRSNRLSYPADVLLQGSSL